MGFYGFYTNYRFLRADGKIDGSWKKLGILFGFGSFEASSRIFSPVDLFTDILFTADLSAKGHPNYTAMCSFIICLPYIVLFLLLGRVYVGKRQEQDKVADDKSDEEANEVDPHRMLCTSPSRIAR